MRIWFVGLRSPELHIARVRSRVARGGHDIPEEHIRERYHRSRINLIDLMPRLMELRVFDNSFEADPHTGRRPRPTLVLYLVKGNIVEMVELSKTPEWARALVAAAVKISNDSRVVVGHRPRDVVVYVSRIGSACALPGNTTAPTATKKYPEALK